MRKMILLLCLSLAVPALPATHSTSWTLRRFLVAVGTNSGAKNRAPLKYAVSDAESLARLMQDMGGVSPADCTLLREPSTKTLQETLQSLRNKIASLREPNVRYEVVFYYSGHADQNGLLLGPDLFPYQNLREWMDGLNADLRITILDGCASGAITRIKGGKKQKPFLVDESSTMRGYAFLTSSTENEAAQESERVKGSFFSYFLMTGMRGAADVNSDGKVTLDEAYQFAFHETLARTVKTQGGVQHPAYDINLVGTGEVVVTDVRQTSAGLILSEELAGRIFIRDENNRLVAELQKPAGRVIELGLEPGQYSLDLQRQPQLAIASVELKAGNRMVLKNNEFQSVPAEAAASRGELGVGAQAPGPVAVPSPRFRTSRIELGMAAWPGASSTNTSGIQSTVGVALSYYNRPRQNLVVGITFSSGPSQVGAGVSGIYSLLPSVRYYPSKSSLETPLNPYLKAGFGPYFGDQVGPGIKTEAVFGASFGAGVDFRLSGRFFFYVEGGYHALTDFSSPVGGKKNYSGGEVLAGLAFQFGKPVSLTRLR